MSYEPRSRNHADPKEHREYQMGESDPLDKLDFLLELEGETDVLLDPSLFTSNALNSTLEMVRDVEGGRINYYISRQFLDTVIHHTQQP